MKKRTTPFFILLTVTLLLSGFVIPPPLSCPVQTYNNWDEHTSEKKISRELRKAEKTHGPHNFGKIAAVLFSKAYLNYIRTGSIDTVTFQGSIESYKKSYAKVKSMAVKAKALYMVALSHYYLGNYANAKQWFLKSAKTALPYSGYASIGLAKCAFKQNDLPSADSILTNYSETKRLQYDSLKRVVLLDMKNGH